MRFRISKIQIDKALQTFKEYIKEQKENNQYLSIKEIEDFQSIEYYINDSTPNEIIREKISYYNRLRRNAETEEIYRRCVDYIDILREVLGEDE